MTTEHVIQRFGFGADFRRRVLAWQTARQIRPRWIPEILWELISTFAQTPLNVPATPFPERPPIPQIPSPPPVLFYFDRSTIQRKEVLSKENAKFESDAIGRAESGPVMFLLNSGMQVYNHWREEDSLEDAVPPWRMGVAIVNGRVGMTSRLNEGELYVLLDRLVLQEAVSPEVVAFYLRHRNLLAAGLPLERVIVSDAEFLRLLQSHLGNRYTPFEKELSTLFDHWPGKQGYLALLKQVRPGMAEAGNKTVILPFLTQKIVRFEEVPIWGHTLSSRIVDLVELRSQGKRLAETLLFESLLNGAGGWADPKHRAELRRLFQPEPSSCI